MGLKDFSVLFLFKPNSKYIFSEDKSQKGQKTKLDEVLRPLRELLSFEEAEEDLEDQETEIEEAEMSNEGTKFATFLGLSFYQNTLYNNFTIKLLSKILSDLSLGVQLKIIWSLILRSLVRSGQK